MSKQWIQIKCLTKLKTKMTKNQSRRQLALELMSLSSVFHTAQKAKQQGQQFTVTMQKAHADSSAVSAVITSIINMEQKQQRLKEQAKEILSELTKSVGKRFAFDDHIVSTVEKQSKFMLLTEDVPADILRARLTKGADENYPQGTYVLFLNKENAGEVMPINKETLKLIEQLSK